METILITAVLFWNFLQMFQIKHLRKDVEWNERFQEFQAIELQRLKNEIHCDYQRKHTK